jgi:hypothetical protein
MSQDNLSILEQFIRNITESANVEIVKHDTVMRQHSGLLAIADQKLRESDKLFNFPRSMEIH